MGRRAGSEGAEEGDGAYGTGDGRERETKRHGEGRTAAWGSGLDGQRLGGGKGARDRSIWGIRENDVQYDIFYSDLPTNLPMVHIHR